MFWLGFVIGLIAAGIAFCLWACCSVGSREDDRMEKSTFKGQDYWD